jgi:hypothetical protein
MNKNASPIVRAYTIGMFMAMPAAIVGGIAVLVIHAL